MKKYRKIISILLTVAMLLTISVTAFATDESNGKTKITDVNVVNEVKDDGTKIEYLTFYENGELSCVTSTFYPNGRYTIETTHGDSYNRLEGVRKVQNMSTIRGTSDAVNASWSYTYWGQTKDHIPVSTLRICADVADVVAQFADYMELPGSMFLTIGAHIFDLVVQNYEQYGQPNIYIKASKYYGIENIASNAIYHHKVITYVYKYSSYTGYLSSGTDTYDSIYFYF